MIDTHVHVGHWAKTTEKTTVAEVFCQRLNAGLTQIICMPTDLEKNYRMKDRVQFFNGPEGKELLFGYWINPYRDLAIVLEEIEFLKPVMLKYHPSHSQKRVNAPDLESFWHSIDILELPLLVHCGRWQEMASYNFVFDLVDQFPTLNVIAAHWGGVSTELKMAFSKRLNQECWPNLFLETSSIITGPITQGVTVEEFKELMQLVPTTQMLFGSDYPFFSMTESAKFLRENLHPGSIYQIEINEKRVFKR